ncbi:MAG TPA: hypothetical protein VGG74_22785 [Kofleriaceae bacterium]
MDAAERLGGDPFDDIKLTQSSTVVLEPGQTQQIGVQFQPSRAGKETQAFQLGTDRGQGPTATLEVVAEGVSSQTATDERIAEQEQERDAVEGARHNDPLHEKRVAADRAVRNWAQRATQFEGSYADWARNNWEAFLGKTGGDVRVDDPSLFRRIATKATAVGVSKVLEVETEVPGVSLAVEKGIEEFTEYFVEKLGGAPEGNGEEAALEATEHVAKESNAKGGELAMVRQRAEGGIHDSESGASLRIAQASSAGELDRWLAWANVQNERVPKKKDPGDREMVDELLSVWLKERAATSTTAGSDTNATAWNKARHELAESGKVPTLAVPDLFIHQCRHEWARLGIAPDEIDAAVDELDARRKQIERDARASGADASEVANRVVDTLGKSIDSPHVAWFHHSANWKQTASEFAKNDVGLAPDNGNGIGFNRRFDLTCTAMLGNDGAGVFVREFWYDATVLRNYSPYEPESHRDLSRKP